MNSKEFYSVQRMFQYTDFRKLNVIQQDIADIFERARLTRPEAFVILKGLREFTMVNRNLAEKWYGELKYGDKFNGFGSHPFNPMEKAINHE